MTLYPIEAFSDNYIWALHAKTKDDKRICVVDPGDSRAVLDYLAQNDLILDSILITHHHPDHIGGVQELKKQTGCHVYANTSDQFSFTDTPLQESDTFSIFDDGDGNGDYRFEVLEIPGHTLTHISYYCSEPSFLFCGDTLFKAGCGKMFEGTPKQFYSSLQKLCRYPDETLIYCTHEYTESNLKFAQSLEPNNKTIQVLIENTNKLRLKNLPTLPSTLALEKQINPFLRCEVDTIKQLIEKNTDSSIQLPEEIFATIRSLKDNF